MGVEMNLIGKSGAYFSYGDLRLGQGRENARQYLEENPALSKEIEAKIRSGGDHPAVLTMAKVERDGAE
jgi:recombination protein RecA